MDYSTLRPSQLQHLASGGDAAAARELQRRPATTAPPAIDVTTLDDRGLRALVSQWQDGVMPVDRDRSRDLAVRALDELRLRYRVDVRLYARPDYRGPRPKAPPDAPWERPRPPRTADWRRPRGSKLYPE